MAAARGFDGAENFGGFGDIFDAFFGGFGASARRAPMPGNDLQTHLTLSFEEAVFGVEKEIDVSRVELCGRCSGNASEPGSSAESCQHCNGTGPGQEGATQHLRTVLPGGALQPVRRGGQDNH